jgi:hypothetical protein
MVDLRPWRAPVAVILLAALAVRVGVGLAGVIEAAVNHSGLLTDLVGLGVGASDVVLIVALAAVCWSCAADDVRGARVFATLGCILVALQVALAVTASVAAMVLPGGDRRLGTAALLVQLTWLVVPILAAAVLLRCARAPQPVAAPPVAAELEPAGRPGAQESGDQPEPPESDEQLYREAAGWEPHEAAGAAWTTAGQAASGGSATGWGSDTGSGWEPADWPSRAAPQTEPLPDQSPAPYPDQSPEPPPRSGSW